MKKKKFNLSGAFALLLALLVLLIFVPINIIAGYFDKGYDMTPAKKYTLNSKTEEFLKEKSDKHIDIYYLSLLKYFQDAEASQYLPLYHTLTELEKYDNIDLHCFRPNEDPTKSQELDPEGLLGTYEGDIFVQCNGVTKKISRDKIFQTGSDGSRQYAGEELIAAAIDTCSKGYLPTVYFLTGHGEKTIGENFSNFAAILKTNNYNVQELDLDDTGSIPGDAKIIYLTGPTKDITSKEKQLLLDYAENGGAMSFLLDPCDTKGRFDNIESIMEEFGLILDYNIVTETTAANMLYDPNQVQSENYLRVEYPAGAQAGAELTQDLTSDLNKILDGSSAEDSQQTMTLVAGISYPRSLTEIPEDSFPAASYVERSSIIRNTTGADGAYTTVSKSMGGDSTTAKEADEKLSGIPLDFGYYSYNKKTNAKLIVIGTTAPIDDVICTPTVEIPTGQQYVSSTSGTRMLTVFSNTWLYDSEVQFGVGNKINSYDSMIFKDSGDASKVITALYIFPALIACIGVFVWLKRRNS
ncbi:Gldg family protein [Ruminococcus sp.]|uniref:Gldg family protein n=1 Tax=Ruminococcus sp. TaxID=41978 RepID=UPI0025E9CB06|nr:Gldg family protein [Ruminococcus sp.]